MNQTVEAKEKRQYLRVPGCHMVAFAHLELGLPTEPTSGMGRTLDFCAGGTRMETSRPLQVGEELALDIALGSQIVHVEATVVHVTPTEPQMIAAGLAFGELPAPELETLNALGFGRRVA